MVATLCGPEKEILSWKLNPMKNFLTTDEKYQNLDLRSEAAYRVTKRKLVKRGRGPTITIDEAIEVGNIFNVHGYIRARMHHIYHPLHNKAAQLHSSNKIPSKAISSCPSKVEVQQSMASKPGNILTDWPWKPLESFKNLGSIDRREHILDYTSFGLAFLVVDRTAKGTNRIVDKDIEFDQVDRERNR
ncbi:pepA [Gossypium arboreum]|uniref:PepA n=1 Tax=Gossypium arboreum TaxID=29729 RepID=A0A0B0Q0W6_GOSAR|nr:pepA [Gossypium arboreum]